MRPRLPLLDPESDYFAFEKIEPVILDAWDLLVDRYDAIDYVLGCGGYGCIIPTRDPGLVIKITSDEREINAYDAVLRARDVACGDMYAYGCLPGIVYVLDIIKLGKFGIEDFSEEGEEEREFYAIFREAVQPLDVHRDIMPLRNFNTILDAIRIIENGSTCAYGYYFGYRTKEEVVRRLLPGLGKSDITDNIIESMIHMARFGYPLTDICDYNMGWSMRPGNTLVIFDMEVFER